MRLVTSNQYSRVMTENIDGMHDMEFNVVVPANTPLTVHETFTVPAGYVGVLRNVTGNVSGTTVAGESNSILLMTRPGQPQLYVFRVASDVGAANEVKVVSTPYNIIMPEGTELQACYSNADTSGPRRVRLYIVLDLIRL